MTISDATPQPTVFIIESPNTRDILDGRVEGEALSSTLKLAEIPFHYFRAGDRHAFTLAFEEKIPCWTMSKEMTSEGAPLQNTYCVPFIHISAPGNELGLGLTNGEFVSWGDLRRLLVRLSDVTGRSRNGESLLQVCFSSCKGAYAVDMLLHGTPYPCFAIADQQPRLHGLIPLLHSQLFIISLLSKTTLPWRRPA